MVPLPLALVSAALAVLLGLAVPRLSPLGLAAPAECESASARATGWSLLQSTSSVRQAARGRAAPLLVDDEEAAAPAIALEAAGATRGTSSRSMADVLGRRRDEHAPARPELVAHGMADRLGAAALLARRLSEKAADAPTLPPDVTYENGETVSRDWAHEYPFNDTAKSGAQSTGSCVAAMGILIVFGSCAP